MNTAVILGLDASSTTIGWVVYADNAARDCGTFILSDKLPIAERCRKAYAALGLILITFPDIDVIGIESPVGQFAKAVIPQARVSGALLATAALRELHVLEIAPGEAKKALAKIGNASKALMQAAALAYGVTGEHAADALGVALACVDRVRVVEQAA